LYDKAHSFWMGCEPVTIECNGCFAARKTKWKGRNPRNVTRTRFRTFFAPLQWEEPQVIYVMPWSDFFIKAADEYREEAWAVIRRTPQHKWLILTKRPENILKRLPRTWGEGWDHVWLGVSIGGDSFTYRIDQLFEIPAAHYWVAVEPFIEPVRLKPYLPGSHLFGGKALEWVVCGAEGGRIPRKMELWWPRELRDECYGKVPFYLKQIGKHYMKEERFSNHHNGGEPEYWPEDLQVREYPVGLGRG
jgi:protein gp37